MSKRKVYGVVIQEQLKKYLKKFNEINSIRGSRYFGPSKMSLFNLIIHSFSIIAVFKYQVFIKINFNYFFIIFLSGTLFGMIMIFFQLMMIVIFNLIIFIVSLREKKKIFK